jgi:hypothetical protein
MTDDTTRTNLVSPWSSILWADNDAYARAMGSPEYSSGVCRMGIGPLSVRSSCRPSMSMSRMSQDLTLVSEISTLNSQMNELQQEKRLTHEQMALHDQIIANLKRIIESAVESTGVATLWLHKTQSHLVP